MPLLKDGKELWPEFANQISGLRDIFRGAIYFYAKTYGFEMPKDEPTDDEWSVILGE